uniref:Uncharacterized protein n=1 Tax=Manihot esculenta TaxID=3983 RepID=A0A2C9WRH3_MANES
MLGPPTLPKWGDVGFKLNTISLGMEILMRLHEKPRRQKKNVLHRYIGKSE